MNNESSTNTGFRHGDTAVIKLWLSGGLVGALGAFLVFAAILVNRDAAGTLLSGNA